MRFLICLLISITSVRGLTASAPTSTEAPAPSKIEELFIWKMSDELSLTATEEKKFTEMVKDLNKKKSDLNTQMQSQLQQMISAKDEATKSRELAAYKKSLQSYNRLSEDELDKIKSLLGVTRTVKYLEVKQDMTNRLKSLLANPEANKPKLGATPLPTPKVIEE